VLYEFCRLFDPCFLALVEEYWDKFSNLCGRLNAPAGDVRFLNEAIVRDTGELDAYAPEAAQYGVQELPPECSHFFCQAGIVK